MASVSNYVYCLGYQGLWRVKIFRLNDQSYQLEWETVFRCNPESIGEDLGLIAMGSHVYMFGGVRHEPNPFPLLRPSWRLFDLNVSDEINVDNPTFLDAPIILPPSRMKPIIGPIVVQDNETFFILTPFKSPMYRRFYKDLSLRSFDPSIINNCFHRLPSPFTAEVYEHDGRSGSKFEVLSFFAISGFLYLFINAESRNRRRTPQQSFTFNTVTKQWQRANEIWTECRGRNVPIPEGHRGEIGVSSVRRDSTRILVAFYQGTPVAYRALLPDNGQLRLLSWRQLQEVTPHFPENPPNPVVAHLHCIGHMTYCAIYNILETFVRIDVFRLNPAQEYNIQVKIPPIPRASSQVLSSSQLEIPGAVPALYDFCLAPGPVAAVGDGGGEEDGNEVGDHEEQI